MPSWTTRLGLPSLNTTGYRPELDGWRGMAILFVLLHHFFPVPQIKLGMFGVHVFFVLSGVLMANILFVKRTDLKIFYQRRLSRVFPVFWLYVLLVYGWDALFGHTGEAQYAGYTLLFIRTYVQDTGIWDAALPIGHLWSLNVEEHAYVLMSLMTLFIRNVKVAGAALLGIGMASIGVKYLYSVFATGWVASDLHTEASLSFLFIAAGYALIKPRHWVIPGWIPLLSVTAALIAHSHLLPWHAKFTLAPWLLAFSVNHLSDIGAWTRHVLVSTPLRLVGLWSFSLYMWQQPLYMWHHNQQGEWWIGGALLLACFPLAWLSFYVFENPVRHWLNIRLTGRK